MKNNIIVFSINYYYYFIKINLLNFLFKIFKIILLKSCNYSFQRSRNICLKTFTMSNDEMFLMLKGLVDSVSKINNRLDAMDKRLDAMDKRFDKRFDAIDKRFDAIDNRLDAMDKRWTIQEKIASAKASNSCKGISETLILVPKADGSLPSAEYPKCVAQLIVAGMS